MHRRATIAIAIAFAATSVTSALGAHGEVARAASEPTACPRAWRLDLGASLDTIGPGRYACPGCDGAITDGERMSAAGNPLGPLGAVVVAADDPTRVLWEGELPPTNSPATRATIVTLCVPPPYEVRLAEVESVDELDAWLCPNSPWSRRIEARHFDAHGRRVPLPVGWRLWRCDDERVLGGVICAVHCWLGGTCDPEMCTRPTPAPPPAP